MWGGGGRERGEWAPVGMGLILGDSRGTSEGAQLGGERAGGPAGSFCFLSSSLSARIPCLWSTAHPHRPPLYLVFLPFSPPVPFHRILFLLRPSIFLYPPLSHQFLLLSRLPSFPTLPHPTMHHSVLVIHLFHLCFLLLLRGGGCDHRNISEGEEGLNWERLTEEQCRAWQAWLLLGPRRPGGARAGCRSLCVWLVMGSNPASFPSHPDDFGQVLQLPRPQGNAI